MWKRGFKNEDLERTKRGIGAVVQARGFPKEVRDLKNGNQLKPVVK